MRNANVLIGALFLMSGGLEARSQGTMFVNLDFEQPILPLVPAGSGRVFIAGALPGWSGYLGGTQTDTVFYNTVSLGAAAISFHDQASSFQPVQGNYSAMLQPSFVLQASAALGQTGEIPSTTMSLLFYGTPSMQVTFAGQPISLVTLGGTSEYFIRGGNISQFAGQTGELRFSQAAGPLGSVMAWLDNIQFSNEPIPEPSTLGFFALGALLLGWRLWRMR
jgi:hypothetical protein